MNTNLLLRIIPTFFLLLLLSCKEEELAADSAELSESAKRFIGMRLASPGAMDAGNKSVMNGAFQNMIGGMMSRNGRQTNTARLNNDDSGDSLIYYDPWISCAEISTTLNDNGSTTTVIDYGEGCNEGWGDYFMKGRLEQTTLFTSKRIGTTYSDEYLSALKYINYGGGFPEDTTQWQINGQSHYEGRALYDTLLQTFSGQYLFSDTTQYMYANEIYDYKSRGRSTYDESEFIVMENEYEYKYSNNYYRSQVLEALVSDNTCNYSIKNDKLVYVWIPVSGKERIEFKEDGKEGSFVIEYGTGECDNILYILENGKRIKIDLSDDWLIRMTSASM
jgi:hypothetical protein